MRRGIEFIKPDFNTPKAYPSVILPILRAVVLAAFERGDGDARDMQRDQRAGCVRVKHFSTRIAPEQSAGLHDSNGG